MAKGTAMEALGIAFTEIGPDYLRATMPVDARTRQPYGLLHGGASVLLAETLGSMSGMLCIREDEICVGIEINANHLRGAREGIVTGTARPLHVGGRTQVWEIRIEDERGRMVCISRLTLAVMPRP
ncbi:hotdog fold thioesterase [Lysobacter niastensis]|nr:hotdog fold thioesterase [Lysobacter niastensis]